VTRRFAPLPTDFAGAHALILAERAAHLEAEADAAQAREDVSERLDRIPVRLRVIVTRRANMPAGPAPTASSKRRRRCG
jgi:hypothetical protein